MNRPSVPMRHIYLRHLPLQEAREKLVRELTRSYQNGELINVIVHGQGLGSAGAPLIKEFVRSFVRSSDFARQYVFRVYPGETGSPFTSVNPGETVVVLKSMSGDTKSILEGMMHGARRPSGTKGGPSPYGHGDRGRPDMDNDDDEERRMLEEKYGEYGKYDEIEDEEEERLARLDRKAVRRHKSSRRRGWDE
ncbi:MAG TPA: hypothetical protein GXX55_07330 [Firmicutes bacterium]|nr:hypothetical protein [Bacillota bacterium]